LDFPAAQYKTDIDFEVPLSDAAWKVLHEARRIKLGNKGFVFTKNGDTPISGFSKFKAHFNGLTGAPLHPHPYEAQNTVGSVRCGLTLRRESVSPRFCDPDRHDLDQPVARPNVLLRDAREPTAHQLGNRARVKAVKRK